MTPACGKRRREPLKRALVFVFAIALAAAGCMPARVVVPGVDDDVEELRLKAGDQIRIVTTQRQRYTLEITEIRATELIGVTLEPGRHETSPKGKAVTMSYDELALLQVRRFSSLHTAGAVAGTVLVIGMVGLVVLGPPIVMPPPP
jgi:hypothetical protein